MNSCVRRVHIPRTLVTTLLTTGNVIPTAQVIEGLPDDARIEDVRFIYDETGMRVIELWVESAEFEPTPAGQVVPVIDIVVEQYHPPKEAE